MRKMIIYILFFIIGILLYNIINSKNKGIDIPKMSSRTGHGGVSKRWQR